MNEAKHVERFMKSAKEADLVLIADRGSNDGTVDLLEDLGANVVKIESEPFRFDTARNIALSHVPKEYDCLISLDLDEMILPEIGWRDEIQEKWKDNVNQLYYLYTAIHREDGTPDIVMKANKIHDRNFRWRTDLYW